MAMELPETLIHRIQSFLTAKEAARTTLLSKSWRSAWSTRPTIDLDESHFPRHDDAFDPPEQIDGLTEYAKKTFQRYEESNLCIDTFSLCLENKLYDHFGLVAEWTLKALKLGATDLTFRFRDNNIDIPLTEVLRSENVQRLCLHGLEIDQSKVAKCTGLKSLTLSDLAINTHQFLDILSCFPLIEYLSLSNISCSYQPGVSRSSPNIILHKLRSLVLSLFKSQSRIKTLFMNDMSSKFPNLKDLTVVLSIINEQHHYIPVEVIRNISSGTLETLNLRYMDDYGSQVKVAGVELDVPSIRKLTFEGSCMPNLCFSPTPGDQWDSHVSITNHGNLSATWFYDLRDFLTNLKGSKIHLCLHLNYNDIFDYKVGEMDGLNVCEIEDLTLDTEDLPSLNCYAFLDSFFRICHPKMITQYVTDDKVSRGKIPRLHHQNNRDDESANTINNDLFICWLLERGMKVKSVLLPTEFMYGLRDLEELNAQQLLDQVWKPHPLGSILDDLTSDQKRRFRLQLKWKPVT